MGFSFALLKGFFPFVELKESFQQKNAQTFETGLNTEISFGSFGKPAIVLNLFPEIVDNVSPFIHHWIFAEMRTGTFGWMESTQC